MKQWDDSLETTIKAYSNMVYRLAFSQTRNKSDADDIYQEVFLRYIRKKPCFETEEHRKAWLIRVTVNCCKKMWALSWRKKSIALEETISFEMEEENNLYYELGKLPMKYRRVIHLFYYEDLSIQKISEILDQKPSTIRTQLTRARYKLKEILKEDYNV
ncbi:sigma-70 family RNA polymerase sigma factor [Irregularibacter muris]|uniref:Sigma-70 family RNA polymerase sigma factor n=1 Tax=Irregularibacter muris TaxID=1796619 RepID=A0AAE3L095_9FIRM|nr:sigma-70 family RNA polymerase sigma factor [Irregularibacter muris]MCR1899971.1 sigma-70 family RNA polymerase sigma factor [Irregularibacter muris]